MIGWPDVLANCDKHIVQIAAVGAFTAEAHFVRDLILDRVVSAAARLNVRISRRAAAWRFTLLQQIPRCERTQQKINRSVVGSQSAFAARCAKVCIRVSMPVWGSEFRPM